MVIFLLIFALGGLTIGSIDQGLDPGRITWWRQTWSVAPITLDFNHVGTRNLTFHFRLSNSIQNGVLQIICPSDLTCQQALTSQTFQSDTDYQVEFQVQILQAGSYGPFGIRTKLSDKGNTIDINNIFGTISVLPEIIPSVLEVEDANGENSLIVSSSIDLTFSFLVTIDIWKFDVIEISIDQNYVVPSSPVCTSETISGVSNKVYGPDGSNTLPCVSDGHSIFIYGISEDVYAYNAYDILLKVTGFETPGFVLEDSYWKLTIYRFGTETETETFQTDQEPVELSGGLITSIAFEPYLIDFSYNATDIVLFMQVSSTLSKMIPSGGKIEITYQYASPLNEWYEGSGNLCLMIEPVVSSSCSVNDNKITVLLAADLDPSTIKVVTRNKLTQEVPQVIIQTSFDEYGIENGSSQDENSGSAENLGMVLQVEGNQGKWGQNNNLSGYSTTYLMMIVTVPANSDNIQNEQFIFSCSFISQDSKNYKSLVLNEGTTYKADIVDNEIDDVITQVSPQQSDQNIVLLGQNISTSTNLQYYKLEVTNIVRGPQVESNIATFYECVFQSSNQTNHRMLSALYQNNASSPSVLSVNPICKNFVGIPLFFQIQDNNQILPYSSEGFQIKLQSQVSLQLGIEGDIPYYSQTSMTATISGENSITLDSIGLIAQTGQILQVYLPFSNPTTSLFTITSTLEQQDQDIDVQNVIYRSVSNIKNQKAPDSTVELVDPTSTIPSQLTTLTFNYTSYTPSSEIGIVGIKLQGGTKYLNPNIQILFQSSILLLSENQEFTGNFVLAVESQENAVSDTQTELILSGIYSLDSQGSQHFTIFDSPLPKSQQQECYGFGQAAMTINSSEMNPIIASTNKCYARNLYGVSTQMLITLQLAYILPVGGKVSLTLSNFATGNYTQCITVIGDCQFSGYEVTVNAATEIQPGVIDINLIGLIPILESEVQSSFLTMVVKGQTKNAQDVVIESDNSSNGPYGSCEYQVNTTTYLPITINSLLLYPNSAGVQNADIFLSLSLNDDLVENSVIKISTGSGISFISNRPQDWCWASINFYSCQYLDSQIHIQIAEQYTSKSTIEFYFDEIVNNPTSSGTKTDLFQIQISWQEIPIARTTKDIEINSSPEYNFYQQGFQINYLSAGETSTYIFNFTVNTTISTQSNLIFEFPHQQYTASIGNTLQYSYDCFDDTTQNLYIDCQSDQLGSNTRCRADHWKLVVDNISEVEPDTPIQIEIKDILNPQSSFVIIRLFLIQNQNLLAYTSFSPQVISNVPDYLEVKRVQTSSNILGQQTDLQISFFTNSDIDSDIYIGIELPYQFKLDLTNSEVECDSSYYNQSQENLAQTVQEFSTVSECEFNDNFLTYIPGQFESLDGFTSNRIVITVKNVINPNWGFPRNLDQGPKVFDNQDNQVFQQEEYWSNRFSVYIIDEPNKKIKQKSFGYMNSAYLYYQHSTDNWMTVNQFRSPINQNSIQVYAGSSSGSIPIQTNNWPVFIESLQVQISENQFTNEGYFSFSSWFHDFQFNYWDELMEFEVMASNQAVQGYYYLEFSLLEEQSFGQIDPLYSNPSRIFVEVCAQDQSIPITVFTPTSNTIYIDSSLFPIPITLERAPETDLNITITADQNINLNPSVLKFDKGISTMYFQVQIPGLFDSQQSSLTLQYSLSGTNSKTYAQPEPSSFTITTTSFAPDPPAFTKMEVIQNNWNSAKITVEADTDSWMYWFLACQGGTLEFQDLERQVRQPQTWTGRSPIELRLSQERKQTQPMPNSQNMPTFLIERLRDHCHEPYYSAELLTASTEYILQFDWLFSQTNYVFGAYLKDWRSETNEDLTSVEFNTTNNEPLYNLTCEFTNLTDYDLATVKTGLALGLKIDQSWLYQNEGDLSWYVLYSDTHTQIHSRIILQNWLQQAENIVRSDLGIEQEEFKCSYQEEPNDNDPPVFKFDAVIQDIGSTYVQIEFILDKDGQVAIVCAETEQEIPQAYQVLLGLDGESQIPTGWVIQNVTGNELTYVTVQGLDEFSQYNCVVTGCNTYPLRAACDEDAQSLLVATEFEVKYSLVFVVSLWFILF